MEYIAGLMLGLAICMAAALIGFDRDRSFYPTVLIVIASYYVLFGVMAFSGHVVMIETLIASGFLLAAIAGFRTSLWVVVVALIGHGVFDYVHHLVIENPGVPVWWPGFCLAIDVTVGLFLAVVLIKRSNLKLQTPAAELCVEHRKHDG